MPRTKQQRKEVTRAPPPRSSPMMRSRSLMSLITMGERKVKVSIAAASPPMGRLILEGGVNDMHTWEENGVNMA